MKKLVIAAIVILIGTVGFLAVRTLSFVNSRPTSDGQDVIYELKPGPLRAVAKDLEERGVISDRHTFTLYAIVLGYSGKIKTGEYLLRTSMYPLEVLRMISSGKSVEYTITVPEGSNMYEIAELVEQKKLGTRAEFLKLCRDPNLIKTLLGHPLPSLEGYLFPETYMLTRYTGLRKLIEMMVGNFKRTFMELVDPHLASSGLTPHQAVILASIIEKETGAVHERGLVSSVFHNRMNKNMKLQTDPTILYGILDETGKMPENIRKSDLTRPTKYNTYANTGLPFGPISNPGAGALTASVQPTRTDFLFFVSQNDGTHVFTQSYKEHNAAVQRFQLDAKAREGKSWRDLSKKN